MQSFHFTAFAVSSALRVIPAFSLQAVSCCRRRLLAVACCKGAKHPAALGCAVRPCRVHSRGALIGGDAEHVQVSWALDRVASLVALSGLASRGGRRRVGSAALG